ncbi:MAG: DUF1311 domain-containing protein [Chloroflexi bacterium]|nr:DUF1311 domain-containing protein [Chloroflexota bacterium]
MTLKLPHILFASATALSIIVLPACNTATPIPIPSSPKRIIRTPTYPSGNVSDFKYKESDCTDTTYGMTLCLNGKAYKSARELDTLLLELDSQFPSGAWEKALSSIILPQEEWEDMKKPYCTFASQESIGGAMYSNEITSCILEQNKKRAETLMWAVCLEANFSKCPSRKAGSELFAITAAPNTTPAP